MSERMLRKDFDALGIIKQSKFIKSGGTVIDVDPNLKTKPRPDAPQDAMYRDDFDKLSAREQMDFAKSGKRIVDTPKAEYEAA